jgi:hypothetical protein
MAIRRARQKQQVIEKLREVAPAGETFVACVHCETGPSPWLNALFDQIPLVGTIVMFTRKFYFMTVTNEHVVLNSANRFTNRPGNVLGSWPRHDFPITNVKRGNVWSKAYVQFAGASKPTRLNINRYWLGEFDQLLAAVSPSMPPPAAESA